MPFVGLIKRGKGKDMFGIGTTELIIIMFIILLIFGAKKLPELAQGLGKGIREFKKASNDIQEELSMDKLDEQIKSTENEKKDEKKDEMKSEKTEKKDI
jgi:TatA/E family protein of Tat protein translocase